MPASSPPSQPSPVSQAFHADTFRHQGHQVVDLLADYLEKAPSGAHPVLPWRDPEDAACFWQDLLQRSPSSENLPDLVKKVLDASFKSQHPRNLGHQVGPVLPAAALVDLVASLLDTGNAVYEVGAPATPMEHVVLRTLNKLVGWPDSADGVLTSGGSLGNLTALLAMRAANPQLPQASHPATILVSSEAHYSIQRAAHIMGLGPRGAFPVPSDHDFRLRRSALEAALQEARQEGLNVLGVVASAGSTATGRIDPLPEIAAFCQENHLWLHVDAAHAGAFLFSEKARPLLAGLEQADSVVIDFHKMLLGPSLLTAVLFQRAQDSYRAFAEKADYLWQGDQLEEWWDGAKRTIECTRPMLGLRAYALLHLAGPALLETYIDQALETTRQAAQLLQESPDFEMLVEPECNILCYRYRPANVSPADLNALQRWIRRSLVRQGRFFIVQVEKRGNLYLRSALMNPFVHPGIFSELMEEIRRLGQAWTPTPSNPD